MSRLSAMGGSVLPGPVRIWTQFRQAPILKGRVLADGTTMAHAAPTGATGDVNLALIPGQGMDGSAGFEWFILGTQTILGPVLTDDGLNIGMDQTNNDGTEWDTGITARNPLLFTVGTDGCYVKLTAKIEDASGADGLIVGFRKQAARQADFNDYTDFATIGCVAGDIKIQTALNNAATVVTDTLDNWADAATHTLQVNVSKAGVVTYQVDDLAPTTVAAFTFDSGDVIMPFFRFEHGTDVAGKVELTQFDAGLA